MTQVSLITNARLISSQCSPANSKTIILQYDQGTSNGRHVELLQKMRKGLGDIIKQRWMNPNSNNPPMGIRWVKNKIGEMFIESDQRPFFVPGQFHNVVIGCAKHFNFFGVDDIKAHVPQEGPDRKRHVFIQQEFCHLADLSKGTYSASRIKPAA